MPPPDAAGNASRRDEFVQTEPRSGMEAGERPISRDLIDSRLFLGRLQNTRGLCVGTLVLLVLVMVVDALSIPVDLAYKHVLDGLDNWRGPTPQQLQQAQTLEMTNMVVGLVSLGLNIGIIVVFLTWLHRSYGNLSVLGARDLAHTPGGAVGAYFIPFINLYRPYAVMQETWKASDPSRSASDPHAWRQASGSALVVIWWIFWLLCNFAGQIGLRASFKADASIEDMKVATMGRMAGALLSMIAAGFLILVIYRITGRQEEKYRALQPYEQSLSSD
ncbi:MAG TPA: DUF4328 domain-containing protein [Gemmataceae bacterium]|nr:DUF4328 domain-containing protein [Gemmataceae bacterium]